MVITVLGFVTETREVRATVFCHVHPHVHLVDAIKLVRTCEQLLVVMRSGATGEIFVHLLPRLAAVSRTPETAGAVVEFDRGIDDIGILRANSDTGLAHHVFGQPFSELTPGFTAVFGLVNAGTRATVHDDCDVTQTLPRNGVHDIGVARIHVNLRNTRVLVVKLGVAKTVTEHLAPVLAAIR